MKKERNPNGAGSMRKRADGRYELIQRITFSNGTKKKKSFYGRTKSEAIRKYNAFLKEVAVMPSSVTNITVAEYFDKYFLPMKKSNIKSDSFNRLCKTVEYQVKPYIGNIPMQQLTKYSVLSMLDALNEKNYSVSTRKKAYDAVNACCKFALGDLIMTNPCDKVPTPSKETGSKKQIIFFTKNEIAIFKTQLFKQYGCGTYIYGKNRWAISLEMQTGMRPGEICGLLLEDINFNKDHMPISIHVQHKALDPQDKIDDNTEKEPAQIVDSLKTDKSNRVIPLTKEAQNAVLALIDVNRPKKPKDMLVTNKYGGVLAPKDLTRIFNRIVAGTKGKIPAYKKGAHTLRRTFASQMYERGYDAKFTAELMGHTSVQMTLDFYTGLSKMKMDKELKRFDSI